MVGKPVIGFVDKKVKILSIGQAPGPHEEKLGKPFAYTAGKTLFKWLNQIGILENSYRENVNMSAVCRCFPGKAKSGDRKPNILEVENCSVYLKYEILYHKPELIIPIGKLAIDQIYKEKNYKLESVIGKKWDGELYGHKFSWIPLPHPSGLNVWNHTEIGKKKITEALELLKKENSIKELIKNQNK
jgi:uracil-DNA glycosylase